MIGCIILISLGLIMAGFFIYGKVTNYSVQTVIIKSIAAFLFVLLGIYIVVYKWPRGNQFPWVGFLFILAAFFGFLGDIALGLKRVFKDKDKLFTMLGMLAFSIGHILYVAGLFTGFYVPGHPLVIIIPLVSALVVGSLAFVIEKLLKINFGKMRIVAVFYLTFLFSLSFSALSLNIFYKFNSLFLLLVLIGGITFNASDLILCKTYFRPKEYVKNGDLIATSVTYFIAQFVLMFALYFISYTLY